MAQKKIIIFLLIPLLLLLCGCRVVLFEDMIKETITSKRVQLESNVFIKKKKLTVRHVTTFPPGSIFNFELRPYPEDTLLKKIFNYDLDAPKESVLSKEIIVNDDGTLDASILDRPDLMKRYLLQITFSPQLQEDSVKEIFGNTGEGLSKGDGVEALEDGSYVYRKYINIMNYEDPDGIGGPLEFLSKAEIEEMFHKEQ
jgi:hypothetical protein